MERAETMLEQADKLGCRAFIHPQVQYSSNFRYRQHSSRQTGLQGIYPFAGIDSIHLDNQAAVHSSIRRCRQYSSIDRYRQHSSRHTRLQDIIHPQVQIAFIKTYQASEHSSIHIPQAQITFIHQDKLGGSTFIHPKIKIQ